MSVTLGGIRCSRATVWIPWSGMWRAAVELDLEGALKLPSGKVDFVIDGVKARGGIDPRRTAKVGNNAVARVVGGLGWTLDVTREHFQASSGVQFSSVASATAASIKETITVDEDEIVGPHFVRPEGRASQIFDGREWYVGLDGVTHLGKRKEKDAPAALGVKVLSWDPSMQVATIASTGLIEPGTVIEDEIFGTIVVRDSRCEIGDEGIRTTAFCGTEGNRVAAAIEAIANAATGTKWSRKHRYRIVQDQGNMLALQAIRSDIGLPDMVPIDVWHGAPGFVSVMTPGAEVLVEFVDGNPNMPVVTAFEPSGGIGFLPIETAIDAVSFINIGQGAAPLAHATETIGRDNMIVSALTALGTAMTTLGAAPLTGAALGSAISAALGAISSTMGTLAMALPTTKLRGQ